MAVAIAAVSYSYITIQISIWLGKRLRISIPRFLPIEEWRMPVWSAGLYALGIIGIWWYATYQYGLFLGHSH